MSALRYQPGTELERLPAIGVILWAGIEPVTPASALKN